MIKEGLSMIGKAIYKMAEKTPKAVLTIAVPLGISMLYAKGQCDVVKEITEQAKKDGVDINVKVV